jgi:integration host factor subunit alpha
MTKAELVEIMCEKTGFTRHESVEFLEKVFAIMKETLEKGEKIKISGFGNFVVREKKPRKGRNPKTGVELTITARRVLTFKPSSILRKVVNKGDSSSAKFGVSEEGSSEIKDL